MMLCNAVLERVWRFHYSSREAEGCFCHVSFTLDTQVYSILILEHAIQGIFKTNKYNSFVFSLNAGFLKKCKKRLL